VLKRLTTKKENLKMNKTLLVALLSSTLALGASAIQAEETTSTTTTAESEGYSKHKDGKGGKHHGKRHGKKRGGKSKMMKRMAKKLNLTEEQQASLKTLREESKAASQPLREEMKALRTEIKALDTTSADYDSQVAILADKKANLTRQAFIQKSSARQKFAAVLTAEQREMMKEMMSKRKGKRGGKHHGNK
jgi:Spy/CpxP family protein refolding chaperone